MICAVNFIVEQRVDVLLVPNAALRYQPSTLSDEQIEEMVFAASFANMDEDQRKAAAEAREKAQNQGQKANTGLAKLVAGTQGPRPPPQHAGEGNRAAVVTRNIWYLNAEGKPEVITVQTGGNNGSLTEILSTEDLEGKQVILREKLF